MKMLLNVREIPGPFLSEPFQPFAQGPHLRLRPAELCYVDDGPQRMPFPGEPYCREGQLDGKPGAILRACHEPERSAGSGSLPGSPGSGETLPVHIMVVLRHQEGKHVPANHLMCPVS